MNEDNIEKASNVPPFVRYVASTIPMVFDNSLSYYEALAALAKSLQDTVDVVNNNGTVTEEYIQLTKDMKEYMDHYFDNLNVQAEINNKLDQMVNDGTLATILGEYVQPRIDAIDQRLTASDNDLQAQINALASGSPLVASSTAGMTDHTKIYVNTSNGHWYYWNGSAWTDGGVYQSTGIGENSVGTSSLKVNLRGEIYYFSNDVSKLGKCSTSYYGNTAGLNTTTPVFILAGTTITFSNDFVSNYHWSIQRIINGFPATGSANMIKQETTDTSYTFSNDELCIIRWRPLDNNWETEDYTVDRTHYLSSSDLTSITYYYSLSHARFNLDNQEYINSTWMFRGYENGKLYIGNTTRFGNTLAYESKSRTIITLNNPNFQMGIAIVETATNNDMYRTVKDSGWLNTNTYSVEANKKYIINIRKSDNSNITSYYNELAKAISITEYPTYEYVDNIINQIPTVNPDYDKYVKGINHRGYSADAPENTIPAFKLSAKKGFKIVESDVQFTSDNVPVMLHDTTIDRTSNGTGAINSMTYAQVRQYDFGSWKGSEFAGTKIPTLYEFLACCKACGLSPRIEFKDGVRYDDEKYNIVINAVKAYDMLEHTTFDSFGVNKITRIHQLEPKANLLYITNGITQAYLDKCIELSSSENKCTLAPLNGSFTDSDIDLAIASGVSVETWTVNTEADILSMNMYISGVTSDNLIAGKVLFDNALGD